MKILFIGNYVDENYFNYIFDNSIAKPIQSVQKFDNLFLHGLIANDKVSEVDVISSAPVNQKVSKRVFWKGKNKKVDGIKYYYVPIINLKIVKQISLLFCGFFILLRWFVKNHGQSTKLIFDSFYPVLSTEAVVLSKLFCVNIVGLYTDVPKCMDHNIKKQSTIRRIIKYIVNIGDRINSKSSDMFILLTEQMNEVINPKGKPYIIMEGLVDDTFSPRKNIVKKNSIMYAGGLYETYGIKMLVDAFDKWNNNKYELWLCGDGDLVPYITNISKNNNKIKYYGSLLNEEIVELEQTSRLLVNPRFSNAEYTKYSFPSKIMEYMISGTPALTTKLPGIPQEYDKYLYYITEENENGLIHCFNEILKNNNELDKKGMSAYSFVKNNKNNYQQANRIVSFIDNFAK